MSITPAIIIRRASADDADAIARVHVDTWRSAYAGIIADRTLAGMSYNASARRQLDLLGDSARFAFVAADSEFGIAGFSMGGPSRDPVADCDGELYGLYVHPDHPGPGNRQTSGGGNCRFA
jgi:ribosomal protein S18 acetylase RimI-like enzyme